MTFDTRYLSNIDPKLVKATFLDFQATDAPQDYLMLAESITIRLCRYDPDRGCHISYVGPKLKPRLGSVGKVGKRRYSPGTVSSFYGAGLGPKRSMFKSPESNSAGMQSPTSPFEGDDVAKWLGGFEKLYGLFKTAGSNAYRGLLQLAVTRRCWPVQTRISSASLFPNQSLLHPVRKWTNPRRGRARTCLTLTTFLPHPT